MSLAFAVYRYATPMTSRKLKYLNFSYSVFNVYRNGYHNKLDLVINIERPFRELPQYIFVNDENKSGI